MVTPWGLTVPHGENGFITFRCVSPSPSAPGPGRARNIPATMTWQLTRNNRRKPQTRRSQSCGASQNFQRMSHTSNEGNRSRSVTLVRHRPATTYTCIYINIESSIFIAAWCGGAGSVPGAHRFLLLLRNTGLDAQQGCRSFLTFWPCGTQGQRDFGRVALTHASSGLVAHATNTEWPWVPHGRYAAATGRAPAPESTVVPVPHGGNGAGPDSACAARARELG